MLTQRICVGQRDGPHVNTEKDETEGERRQVINAVSFPPVDSLV